MTDHIARLEKARKRGHTGTLLGGNPPDSGSAWIGGTRIAFLPIEYVSNLTESELDALDAAYQEKGATLGRQEARAALAPFRAKSNV